MQIFFAQFEAEIPKSAVDDFYAKFLYIFNQKLILNTY